METEEGLRSAGSETPASAGAVADFASLPELSMATGAPTGIKISRSVTTAEENGQPGEVEAFTMTLGNETIKLLPLRNWGQLDLYKWRVRGKLPATPPGLEITFDHVKVAGETVLSKDPGACSKLEKLFNEWLALEQATLELARKKTQAKPEAAAPVSREASEPEPFRFKVDIDKRGQVHVDCIDGREPVASIGLSMAGFNSLFSQGFMRKPGNLKAGALHDWVEIDGILCSFEKGQNDAAKLEQLLNERYRPATGLGKGKEVVVLANAASSTGFDIQFPLKMAGRSENHRWHLGEEALESLQDAEKCGLLKPGLLIKLSRPCLIFKRKMPDGGETYLEHSPANVVTISLDNEEARNIDLSQPVNYLHLSPVELTAIFNHPAVNRHSKPSSAADDTIESKPAALKPPQQTSALPPGVPTAPPKRIEPERAPLPPPLPKAPAEKPAAPETGNLVNRADDRAIDMVTETKVPARPLPNSWLSSILQQESVRHDWLTCLVYNKLAREFGNSREGTFGPSACFAIALTETKHIEEPSFKGIFLTGKGGLGFLSQGHLARFNKGAAFIGTEQSTLEGAGVRLVGVGLDARRRIVFIVSEGYRPRFGVSDSVMTQAFSELEKHGAIVMATREVLESPEAMEVVWTVPAEQEKAAQPQALESRRPSSEVENHG